jgi:hypothetical protein
MKNFWEPAVKRIQKKLKRTEKRVRKRTLQRLENKKKNLIDELHWNLREKERRKKGVKLATNVYEM